MLLLDYRRNFLTSLVLHTWELFTLNRDHSFSVSHFNFNVRIDLYIRRIGLFMQLLPFLLISVSIQLVLILCLFIGNFPKFRGKIWGWLGLFRLWPEYELGFRLWSVSLRHVRIGLVELERIFAMRRRWWWLLGSFLWHVVTHRSLSFPVLWVLQLLLLRVQMWMIFTVVFPLASIIFCVPEQRARRVKPGIADFSSIVARDREAPFLAFGALIRLLISQLPVRLVLVQLYQLAILVYILKFGQILQCEQVYM